MKTLAFLAAAVCLLAAGCYDTNNPLSDPQTAKPDEKLFGVWRCRTSEEDAIYHVGSAGKQFPKGMMRIVVVKHSEGEVESPDEYLAFPTVIGDKTYLNLVSEQEEVQELDNNAAWKPEVVSSYTLSKYELEGDKLTVQFPNETAKSQAIKDKKIKGKRQQRAATFTDSSENVARFVAAADASLWNTKDAMRFERVHLEKKP